MKLAHLIGKKLVNIAIGRGSIDFVFDGGDQLRVSGTNYGDVELSGLVLEEHPIEDTSDFEERSV